MVGVAGRSKGCNTCRKRKIACDLQRPQCWQCTKSNRLCTGYQREAVFIVNQGHETVDVGIKPEVSNIADPNNVSAKAKKWGKATRTKAWKAPKSAVQVMPVHSVSTVAAYRQSLHNAFIRCYVPIDHSGFEQTPWLLQLVELTDQTQALTTALLAVSLAKVGRENHDSTLVRESLRLYTQGLWELQKALWEPELMYKDETLSACMLLALYELFACPAQTRYGYASHRAGCARLVQLRGPEAHVKGLGHAVFQVFRSQGILQALDAHASTFLTEPEWMKTPWLKVPKTPLDQMWDLVGLSPEIHKQADELRHLGPSEAVQRVIELIQRTWDADAELQDFYRQLDESLPGPLYWPELSTTDNPADNEQLGKVCPVAFHFCNLMMANTLMLYWATLTMLWHGMTLLYGSLDTIPFDRKELGNIDDLPPLLRATLTDCGKNCPCKSDPKLPCITKLDASKLPPLAHRVDFLAVGRNVCQTVEYCMQAEMMDYGPSSVVAPLSIVVETIKNYPHCARETAWIHAVLVDIQEKYLPYLKYAAKP